MMSREVTASYRLLIRHGSSSLPGACLALCGTKQILISASHNLPGLVLLFCVVGAAARNQLRVKEVFSLLLVSCLIWHNRGGCSRQNGKVFLSTELFTLYLASQDGRP